MQDGRKFVVVEKEIEYYREFGTLGDPADYLYSKWRRKWELL